MKLNGPRRMLGWVRRKQQPEIIRPPMPLPVALRTCALILKHAGDTSPALVAIMQTPTDSRDERMLLAGKLGDVLLADQQTLADLKEIIENIIGRRIESPVPVMDIVDEVKSGWTRNRMDEWLRLGRSLDLFSAKDIAGWAWLIANWEARHQHGSQRPD